MESWAPPPSKDNTLTQKQFQRAFSSQLSEKSSAINRYSTAGREVSGIWQSKVCTPAFPPSGLVVVQLLFPLRESPEPETPKPPSGPKTINTLPPTHSSPQPLSQTSHPCVLKSRNGTFADSKKMSERNLKRSGWFKPSLKEVIS